MKMFFEKKYIYKIFQDLKNSIGMEHPMHRKKILNSISRLKIQEASGSSTMSDLYGNPNLAKVPVNYG